MALGASKEDILHLVIGHGLRLTFVGVGLPGCVFCTDALPEQLAAGCDQHRCADVFVRGDSALQRGALRVLHSRAPRHAPGPDGRAALRMKGVVIQPSNRTSERTHIDPSRRHRVFQRYGSGKWCGRVWARNRSLVTDIRLRHEASQSRLVARLVARLMRAATRNPAEFCFATRIYFWLRR